MPSRARRVVRRVARWLCVAAAAVVALTAAPAVAAGYGASGYGATGVTRDAWPEALTLRPLALPRGMAELAAPVGIDVSPGVGESPVRVPLSVYVGATDWLTVGVTDALTRGSAARGPCVPGGAGGCAGVSDDVRVDALAQFHSGPALTAAYGLAVTASPFQGAVALSTDARLVLRLAYDPVALVFAPDYGFGLARRDLSRLDPATFPLATSLSFGTFQGVPNRETVDLPVTALVQLGPHAALAAAIALDGVVDPPGGRVADGFRVPAGFAAVFTPLAMLDLGAAFTFADLRGRSAQAAPRPDAHVLEAFVALRPGAKARRAASPAPALAAATPAAAPAAEPGSAYLVAIDGFAFAPASLEVPAGATVTVVNRDGIPHSVTSERAPGAFAPGGVGGVSFDTGVFNAGARTFTVPADAAPGTVIPYYCAVHREGMKVPNGEIRVTAPR